MPRACFQCLLAAAFFSLTPAGPDRMLEVAKVELSVPSKITQLRRLINEFPGIPTSQLAQDHLVALLAGSNRFEEAVRQYQREYPEPGSGDSINFRLLDYWLKTGRFNDLLKATGVASGPTRDFLRDQKLLELRVQAFLAKGRYALAREAVERWLETYEKDGEPETRFETDVQSMQFLRRHLLQLERMQGAEGKALFTASVPDSLQHWSHKKEVPIFFFKLIPAHPAGQPAQAVLPGRHDAEEFFQSKVDEMNRGLTYVSGGDFSLAFRGVETLYVKRGDVDPVSSGGHVLTSRVYTHTLPQLYRLAGQAFVVLVDYRATSEGEAAYMGDGLIHLSATKLQPMILMHEVLHGLGATHQEWSGLVAQGYRFDPDDRGLMTFERGEIRNLGLEEKNRALLGWPRVSVVRLGSDVDLASLELPNPATTVATSELAPGLN